MDAIEVDTLVRQLAAGFETLQDEYQQLHGQHQALERKLVTAREQYNELAKIYGTNQTATPPLSLSSSPAPLKDDAYAPMSTLEILSKKADSQSAEAAREVRAAIAAANTLTSTLPKVVDGSGVKIWAGPSADRREGSSCMMPSISESSLEQDFTVEGTPSKLGCPFASMATKKLSSHAASVLSRYNQSNSVGGHGSVAASTPLSTASRINGRESFMQRRSRRASFADPIKAEICGLSDHAASAVKSPPLERLDIPAKAPTEHAEATESGVCPIRFLDQHSPEEVATYFEKHKHELPRSHEVCVMRYRSNEQQIRELDAKYGNLVSMIQGLGQKHKDMLPEEPDEAAEEDAEEALDDAKIRKWASSVSAQAPEAEVEDDPEERQPHFERPVREIRVGESPSRPWGIQVPAQFTEDAKSEVSSRPVHIAASERPRAKQFQTNETVVKKPAGKCPFGHGAVAVSAPEQPTSKPVFLNPGTSNLAPQSITREIPETRPETKADDANDSQPRMVFTGPVFIGYSPEDAAKILSNRKAN